jgi:hypothetical protein
MNNMMQKYQFSYQMTVAGMAIVRASVQGDAMWFFHVK